MGALIREHDWAATALGPPSAWPQSLKTAVRIMLTSRQPIWIGWGPQLIYLYNDAYQSIIGGKHPWALGRPTREVWREIWPDIGPLLATAMGGVEGTYVEEQLLIMERNGYPEETYYTFSYSPIPDDDGSPGGIICANTDDTGRVIGDRQINLLRELAANTVEARSWREAAERSAAALATEPRDLPFALLMLSDESAAAPRLVAAAGVSTDQAAAWPIDAVLADNEPRVVDIVQRFGDAPPLGAWDQPPSRAAVLSLTSSGETGRPGVLIVGLNPFRLFDETYRGFLGLVAGQIASAVASADAYEEERRRAEALAEIDRAKTAFFSNVSHEFRTPLTLILGPLEDALDQPDLPADARTQLELAHRNGARLLRLVNSLLDFSRIEAGRAQASFRPTDLARFSADVASSFRAAIEKAGLTFDIDCEGLPQPVFVDRDMWETVLLNLLSNAFKFTLQGRISVSVAADPHGRGAVVTVEDTGIGIPQAELPRLFERFHRVAGAQGRSFEGSGIGLALVSELVKLHGGEIVAESTPGEGTKFTVTLPFGASHLPPEQVAEDTPAAAPSRTNAFLEEALGWLPQEPPIPAGAPQAVVGAGRRVILADDNADMRSYVARLLEAQGYEVRAFADGEAALVEARRERPDLILTDVMMPRLDGFGLIHAIRGEPATADLPVVMLSARAGEEAKVEGLDAGADDYMVKPFAARELLARVNANIQMAQIRRDAARAIEAELVQRRKAEAQLQALNTSLEERVASEIAERVKAEDALRQAQKMEAIGQLTGGVAHDFNNLLTVIIGGLDIIGRSRPDDRDRISRALDMSLKGAQRAASLTSRLLAFSRRQPLDPKPLELNVLVNEMTDLLHRTLGEQIELEGTLAPRLWRIEADHNQLESALINLAVNARDAMPEGGKLTIETFNTVLGDHHPTSDGEVAPGDYVVIAVSDTGSGMSKEVLGRVFEPFFTTKEVGRGTGLGLSMVYGFVKQSGGHVTIDSEEGAGTTVRLYFPRHAGAEAAPEGARQVATASPPSRGEVVLLVEDNEGVRNYSAMILSELGYGVIEAAEAEEALSILKSGQPIDLLFTDVVLPGQSGRVLADAATSLRPGLKVLFTTGYARDAIVHHGRLDAGVQLIAKPFTFEHLAVRVREVLDGT